MVGRPREFDEAAVLEKVMTTFWTHGYRATAMEQLITATGLSRQSLYNAFGNKRSLLIHALRCYGQQRTQPFFSMLRSEEGKAIDRVRGILQMAAKETCDPSSPGCMVVNVMAETEEEDGELRQILEEHLSVMETSFRSALVQAQAEGDLAASTDPADLARTLTCSMLGLATLARFGIPGEYGLGVVKSLEKLLK